MRKLGFKLAKAKTIAALRGGPQFILFEEREGMEAKNLLASGVVTPDEVIGLLRVCQGGQDQYRETPHHQVARLPVHEFKPVMRGVRWYIKVYFLDGTGELEPAIFISVHESQA